MGRTLDVTVLTSSDSLRVPFDNLDGDAKIELASRLMQAIVSGGEFSENSGMGTPMPGIFLGGFLSLAGLFCLGFLQTSTVVGSRNQGTLSVKVFRWLILNKRESSIELSDFRTVKHVPFSIESYSGISATSNSVFVESKTGETMHLASGPMFTEESTESVKRIVGGWVRAANRLAKKR